MLSRYSYKKLIADQIFNPFYIENQEFLGSLNRGFVEHPVYRTSFENLNSYVWSQDHTFDQKNILETSSLFKFNENSRFYRYKISNLKLTKCKQETFWYCSVSFYYWSILSFYYWSILSCSEIEINSVMFDTCCI